MKKILLLTLFILISFMSFSQNKDILGFWNYKSQAFEIKTNYPLLTQRIESLFGKKGLNLENLENPLVKLTNDGRVYERGKDKEITYEIHGDSIHIGILKGVFSIKDDVLTITSDMLDKVLIYTSQFQNGDEELDKLGIPNVDSIRIEKAIAIIQLQISEGTFDIRKNSSTDVEDLEENSKSDSISNSEVIGFWEILGSEVDVKTSDKELTEKLKKQFTKKKKIDKEGRPYITQFAPDGKVYDKIGARGSEYKIKGDSIDVGDVLGVFTIEDDMLTITCDVMDDVVRTTEEERQIKIKKQELAESEVPPIQIDRVLIKITFRRTDRSFEE